MQDPQVIRCTSLKPLVTVIPGDGGPRGAQSGYFEALVGSLPVMGLGPTAWRNTDDGMTVHPVIDCLANPSSQWSCYFAVHESLTHDFEAMNHEM